MVQRLQLKVQKRKMLGKKVKRLRKEGIVPANIYGKKIKSLAVQVSYPEFTKIYKEAGETSVVDLIANKTRNPRHTLIRKVQLDPVTDKILHIDFMQVDLKEKIEAEVPIRLEGESPAVRDKKALLLQELNELRIEATADKLPEEIVVKVDTLTEIGTTLYVKDLKIPAGVEAKTDSERVVVRLAALVAKEAEELVQAEEAAAEEVKAEEVAEIEKETEEKESQTKKEEHGKEENE